jgi:hypothetical protein
MVAVLNTAALTFPIDAQTSDRPYHDLEDITDSLKVNVVRGGRQVLPITRGRLNQCDYFLHVGVMKRYEGLNNDDLECKFKELDAFLDELWQYLLRQTFGIKNAMPFALEIVAPYSVDHRDRLRQFTAEFVVTLRLIE